MVKVNITNIYGMSADSSAEIAQNQVATIAKQLGFNELGIYFYNSGGESSESMSARIDGINASLQFGDIVIFQLPTWNAPEFEYMYVDKLKSYGAKIVFFIQDIPPLMFKANYHDWMQPYINFCEQADLLILPSPNMAEKLHQEGLRNNNIIYQNLWDHLTSFEPKDVQFSHEVNFLGNQQRFPFTKDWNYKTPLRLFAKVNERNESLNVEYMGFYPGDKLFEKLDRGFGLCWSVNTDDQDEEAYSHLNASYKLSTYLAAGMPVIANKGISSEKFIKDHNLGIVLDSLDDLDDAIQNIDESQYNAMAHKARNVGYLLRNGYMTKKVLIKAVEQVMLND